MMNPRSSPDMMSVFRCLVDLYHEGRVSGYGSRSIEYDVCTVQIQRRLAVREWCDTRGRVGSIVKCRPAPDRPGGVVR